VCTRVREVKLSAQRDAQAPDASCSRVIPKRFI
jgi:hypothetical protein